MSFEDKNRACFGKKKKEAEKAFEVTESDVMKAEKSVIICMAEKLEVDCVTE